MIVMAALMILLTTAIHATAMFFMLERLASDKDGPVKNFLAKHKHIKVSFVIVTMFLASVVEALAWALTYIATGAIEGFEKALYFSMVTYTTLGYGDVTLGQEERLLSAFESANRIIMFGWTTAIVLAVVNHVYFGKELKP